MKSRREVSLSSLRSLFLTPSPEEGEVTSQKYYCATMSEQDSLLTGLYQSLIRGNERGKSLRGNALFFMSLLIRPIRIRIINTALVVLLQRSLNLSTK